MEIPDVQYSVSNNIYMFILLGWYFTIKILHGKISGRAHGMGPADALYVAMKKRLIYICSSNVQPPFGSGMSWLTILMLHWQILIPLVQLSYGGADRMEREASSFCYIYGWYGNGGMTSSSETFMCHQSSLLTASCPYGTWLMDPLDGSTYLLYAHLNFISYIPTYNSSECLFCISWYVCVYMPIYNTYVT